MLRHGQDTVGGALEFPRPSLHFCLDMGSSSFNSKTLLFYRHEGQVVGTVEPDVAHRRHNNYLNALFKVGM